jgi:integrase/recombinase XerD
MASGLFKVTTIQYWMPDQWLGADGLPCPAGTPGARFAKGRRVTSATPGAKKVKKRSAKWYGRIPGQRKAIPLSKNKVVAQQMLAAAALKDERQKLGIFDPFELHRKRALAEHLKEWEGVLHARGNTEEYVELKVGRVSKVLDACRFVMISDLSASRVESAIADMRGQPRFGTQTANHYLGAVKQFARWLVKDRRMIDNPLAHLEGGNVKLDRRHERRDVTDAELVYLLNFVRASIPVRRMSGPDREMLYLVAIFTGLRASELASLSPASFALDEAVPVVNVAAGYSKRRREDDIPLHADLVARLRPWLQQKPASRLWPGKWAEQHSGGKILKADLAAARAAWIECADGIDDRRAREASDFLAYRNAEGHVADFHALRHTFITRLVRSGVRPKEAQALARHSTITLTLDRYAHTGLHDVARAMDLMPSLQGPTRPDAGQQVLKATGTDDRGLHSVCTKFVQTADPSRLRLSPDETSEGDGGGARNEQRNLAVPLNLTPVATMQDTLRPSETSGGGEIRTLERLATSPVFKTGAIGRSATPPGIARPAVL